MRRWLATLLVALPLSVAGMIVDVPPPRPEVALLMALPAELGGFRRPDGPTNFARMAHDERLGAAVEYRSGLGVVATVYLYDAGRSDIGGPGTPALLAEQLALAVDDVRRAGEARRYTVEAERPLVVAGLLCHAKRLVFQSGPVTETAVCLGSRAPFFMQLRMTTPPAAAGSLIRQLDPFAAALTAALR